MSSVINLADKNILVVEDDEMNFIYLKQILKLTKGIYTRARTGKKALQLIENEARFDLVLMDLQLPDIHGLEVTRAIKTHKPELIVIAQTAAKSDEEVERALQAGCDDVLTKPFTINAFSTLVAKYF
jgi:two-component system sensor histidine kinase EvgS